MPDRDYIQKLADDRYEGEIRNRFLESISDIAGKLTLEEIADRVNDADALVRDLELKDEESWDKVKAATAVGFGAAGKATMGAIPSIERGGQKVKITFDTGNRKAAQAVDNLHTDLIREISEDSRAAIANEIRDGLERGKNPRAIAHNIRGTYNYSAKHYDNGVLGLTRQQQKWVSNAERQLMSGDPKEMRQYLGRKLRDRRYDRTVLNAINEGRPLKQSEINKITEAYRRRAIKYRAETIGRDQSLEALTQGQESAMDQVVDEGAVQNKEFIKQWITSGDSRVRDAHASVPAMNRGGVRRDRMFETPLGPLKRPRDRNSPGSVRENVIQCFLPDAQIEGNILAASKAWYSGEAIEVQTAGGARLSVTSNHPVMTNRGLVPAKEITEGDDLVNAGLDIKPLGRVGDNNVQGGPASVEKIFSALEKMFFVFNPRRSEVDFHGDGRFMRGDVDIVYANALLMRALNADVLKSLHDFVFEKTDAVISIGEAFTYLGHSSLLRKRSFSAAGGRVSSSNLTLNLARVVFAHLLPFYQLGLRLSAGRDSVFNKPAIDNRTTDAEILGDLVNAGAGPIFSDDFFSIQTQSSIMPERRNVFISKLSKALGNSTFSQNSVKGGIADSKGLRNFIQSHAGLVKFENVVQVKRFNFSGHVYDLQSDNGLLVANGFITSNCRCSQFIKVRRNNQ